MPGQPTELTLPIPPSKTVQAPRRVSFASLDAFRGLAALWVVACHGTLETVTIRFPQLRHQPLYAVGLLGMLGVQLFFVISGFCIANAATSAVLKGGTTSFVWARLRRIYPPYFFALSASLSLGLLAAWLVAHNVLHGSVMAESVKQARPVIWWVSQFTMTQVPLGQQSFVTVFWTLCYEVAFYAVVAVTMLLVRLLATPRVGLLAVLDGITAVSMGWLAVTPGRVPFPFDLWPQFGLGVLVFQFVSGRRPWAAMVAVGAGLALFLLRVDNSTRDPFHVGARTTFAVAAGFAAILVFLHRSDARLTRLPPIRLLTWIGAFSYSLYLTHLIPMGIVLQLGRPLLGTPRGCGLVYGLEVAATVAFAYPFFLLCERPFLSRRATVRVQVELEDRHIFGGGHGAGAAAQT
jgi:exopolysaccharide production protein ExoZ